MLGVGEACRLLFGVVVAVQGELAVGDARGGQAAFGK
jgi:hypothetical protein